MPTVIIAIISFIASGIIFRVLASIGFGLGTAAFVNNIVDKYLTQSIQNLNTALDPDIAAYLNILRLDEVLSIIIGSISFIATYKSLKLIFIRK